VIGILLKGVVSGPSRVGVSAAIMKPGKLILETGRVLEPRAPIAEARLSFVV